MAIKITERPKQEGKAQFGSPESSKVFIASGSSDKAEIMKAIWAEAPDGDEVIDLVTGESLPIFRDSIRVRELGPGPADGQGVWEGTVGYSDSSLFELKINNGVQSIKMLQAPETIRVWSTATGNSVVGGDFEDIPDFKNAINVSGFGRYTVDGVEVEKGKLEFSITKKYKTSGLDAGYEMYLASITPSKNDAVWGFAWKNQLFTFAKGSVLFRGHTTDEGAGTFSITHNFAYSRGLTIGHAAWKSTTSYAAGDRVTFGGHVWTSNIFLNEGNTPGTNAAWADAGVDQSLTIGEAQIFKEGWDYGYPWYGPDESNGVLLPQPKAFVVVRVHEPSDFEKLQLF